MTYAISTTRIVVGSNLMCLRIFVFKFQFFIKIRQKAYILYLYLSTCIRSVYYSSFFNRQKLCSLWDNSCSRINSWLLDSEDRIAQLVYRLATRWTVVGSNTGGGGIFRTCPARPWGLLSFLFNGYRVFPGGKGQPGRDADPSPPSNAMVRKE